jgi:hypothetical protein
MDGERVDDRSAVLGRRALLGVCWERLVVLGWPAFGFQVVQVVPL